MEIRFRTTRLRKQYAEFKCGVKAYGDVVAGKYIDRINILQAARDLHEVKRLPGLRCHPLKGDRKGKWAINLTGQMRLIFTLEGDHLEIVRIEEVSKHYED